MHCLRRAVCGRRACRTSSTLYRDSPRPSPRPWLSYVILHRVCLRYLVASDVLRRSLTLPHSGKERTRTVGGEGNGDGRIGRRLSREGGREALAASPFGGAGRSSWPGWDMHVGARFAPFGRRPLVPFASFARGPLVTPWSIQHIPAAKSRRREDGGRQLYSV